MATKTQKLYLARRTRLIHWIENLIGSRRFAVAIVVASAASGLATYAALTGSISRQGADPLTILVLLNVDLVLLLILSGLVCWRLIRLWIARRKGSIGSRLHSRMVTLFGLVAATPAVIVAVFSIGFFNFGLEAWFNEQVVTAFERSRAVAEAYIKDHQKFIRADVLSIAAAINRIGPKLTENQEQFNELLDNLATERSVSEAIVIRRDGKVLAHTKLSFLLTFDSMSSNLVDRAALGEVVVVTSQGSDRVRAISRIDNIAGTFLYIGRFVDRDVLDHLERVTLAVNEYEALKSKSSSIQIIFTLLYLIVALLLLFAAIWVGLIFANRVVKEISNLVVATEKVRDGDLTARVAEGPEGDEIGSLSRAFNRMTSQLENQRAELIKANRQLDERRRFTETVLFGVSSGVIGLDADGTVSLPNRAALDLLGAKLGDLTGRPILQVFPELAHLLDDLRNTNNAMVQDEVKIIRIDRVQTLLVRLSSQSSDHKMHGYVVTFDDISELVNAQRAAAWSDVARRIAHEIKNPLTPIQLAAERLKRKFLSDISTDQETFSSCVNTIVRQVASIRGMVDEFSAFARMPAPVRNLENLIELVAGIVTIQRMARNKIVFISSFPPEGIKLFCDARQIEQAMTNLLQNAINAVDASDKKVKQIEITISLRNDRGIDVLVQDNGCGLPRELLDRLMEPYVTTREKGTGLGLAIVKKIMEDHGGTLELKDVSTGGACVTLIFPTDAVTLNGDTLILPDVKQLGKTKANAADG